MWARAFVCVVTLATLAAVTATDAPPHKLAWSKFSQNSTSGDDSDGFSVRETALVTRDNRGDDATTQYPVSLSLTLHDVFGVSFRLRLTRNDGLFGDAYHTSQWDENVTTKATPASSFFSFFSSFSLPSFAGKAGAAKGTKKVTTARGGKASASGSGKAPAGGKVQAAPKKVTPAPKK